MSFYSISIRHEILRDFSVLWHDILEQKNNAQTQGNHFLNIFERFISTFLKTSPGFLVKNAVSVLQNYPCIALRWLEPVFF